MKKKKNWLSQLFDYVRPSFEAEDGKFSYKRVTAFVFVCLISAMVKHGFENPHQVTALIVLAVLLLMFAALISAPQLIEGLKALATLKAFSVSSNESTPTVPQEQNPE